jgi:hypothetical protein
MSDVPGDVARLLVQAPTHGPVVRITLDHVDITMDDDGHIGTCIMRDVTHIVEFADNSAAATESLEHSYAHDHSGVVRALCWGTPQLPVYIQGSEDGRHCMFRTLANWVTPNTHFSGSLSGDPHRKRMRSGENLVDVVIVRSMELVAAGTWQPTAAERAYFDSAEES